MERLEKMCGNDQLSVANFKCMKALIQKYGDRTYQIEDVEKYLGLATVGLLKLGERKGFSVTQEDAVFKLSSVIDELIDVYYTVPFEIQMEKEAKINEAIASGMSMQDIMSYRASMGEVPLELAIYEHKVKEKERE